MWARARRTGGLTPRWFWLEISPFPQSTHPPQASCFTLPPRLVQPGASESVVFKLPLLDSPGMLVSKAHSWSPLPQPIGSAFIRSWPRNLHFQPPHYLQIILVYLKFSKSESRSQWIDSTLCKPQTRFEGFLRWCWRKEPTLGLKASLDDQGRP